MSIIKNLLKLFKKSEPENLRNTIEELIEEREETEPSIESGERALLENVLNLRDLTAQDVMIPRADIISCSITHDADEMIQIMVKNSLTFLPICSDTLDHIVGVIHIKDVLSWLQNGRQMPIKHLVKDVLFIAPSMRALDLLVQMRETYARIAFVVDEYGGIDGLVTFSNVISEVIGDIQDSTDLHDTKQIEIKPDGTVISDGRVPLEELQEVLGAVPMLTVDEDEGIDTIGGLVIFLAGRVPVRGEIIRHPNGGEFEVLEADPRRVRRLKMRP
jgi:CBS domain containing-hemolysin-like protein